MKQRSERTDLYIRLVSTIVRFGVYWRFARALLFALCTVSNLCKIISFVCIVFSKACINTVWVGRSRKTRLVRRQVYWVWISLLLLSAPQIYSGEDWG